LKIHNMREDRILINGKLKRRWNGRRGIGDRRTNGNGWKIWMDGWMDGWMRKVRK
jgi:hypothetical protein